MSIQSAIPYFQLNGRVERAIVLRLIRRAPLPASRESRAVGADEVFQESGYSRADIERVLALRPVGQ